ncbi:MAG: DUF262 domain-containing protein [Actinomycetales bacterium]|nr:DUF262 domain-containing protein [Actinomycetales bacterium]
MEAKETDFIRLFDGTKHFVVPHFQRLYSWETKHCRDLVKDIAQVATSDAKRHFVGSIVYVSHQAKADGVNQFVVIDGQQRLTTLSLLFLAVLSSENLEPGELKKKLNRLIRNADEKAKTPDYYKLQLTRTDDESFRNLVDAIAAGVEITPDASRVHRNFLFMRDEAKEQGLSSADLWSALSRLDVVYIALSARDDHPQAIFESLNSTGKSLSQTDLIRNFVLMDLEPEDQSHLYDHYWSPIELDFKGRKDTEFEDFMRMYLTVTNKKYPLQRDVFDTFKRDFRQAMSNGDSRSEVLKSMKDLAKAYKLLSWSELDAKDPLGMRLAAYRATRNRVLNPLVMKWANRDSLGSDFDSKRLIKALGYLESYVVRRAFCGLGNNALDKVVASCFDLMERSQREGADALADALLSLGSGRMRFPLDEEVMRKGGSFDLYSSPLASFILQSLESTLDPKGFTIGSKVSIEHIMPQTSTRAWEQEVGPELSSVRERWLHTIANLTLTTYNAELGNRSFDEKKHTPIIGFESSKFAMTKRLTDFENWTESELMSRSEEMLRLVVKTWPMPEIYNSRYSKIAIEMEKEELTIGDLLAEGLISADDEIFWARPNLQEINVARITDGGMIAVADGDEYETPTAATRHFTTSNYNGWKVWRLGSLEGETLDDLRERYQSLNS